MRRHADPHDNAAQNLASGRLGLMIFRAAAAHVC
jgi:hypothetical protein